jgi:hypothetical protein
MRSAAVVEVQAIADRTARLADSHRPSDTPPHLTLRYSRSTNTLSREAPLPSMLIAMPLAASTPAKAVLVNCDPWSVLKMSGFP